MIAPRLSLVGLLGLTAAVAAAEPSGFRSPGERLYQTGVTAGGGGVPAVVQGDLRVSSTEMPCAGCHRRSGFGGGEGQVRVAPIAAGTLFSPITRGSAQMGTVRTSGQGTRPAYTDDTLLRVIREGIDPSGRVLSPTMPRYALGDEDGARLVAHLRALGSVPPPGVTAAEVHLATVTSPGVDAGDRQVMLDVLRAYVRDKNAGTRNETGRRERGPWDMKQHYDAYRAWKLHEWELSGPVDQWPAQLARRYEDEPVFALVGGIVDDDWAPVHEFAERFRVPVILPQTPQPAIGPASDGFYTLYFSRGVILEADTLAERLAREGSPHVLQVSRCGTPGQAAATRLRQRLPAAVPLTDRCVERAAPLSAAVWGDHLPAGATLALWLNANDAVALLPGLPASAGAVYLSSTLLGSGLPRPPQALGDRTLVLQPGVPPMDLERHAGRALTWLRAKGLADRSPRVAVNALFAPLLAVEALAHSQSLTSREYFLERIEAMAGLSPNRSAYPETVFGPQRRFGSAGCYVLQIPAAPDAPYRKVGEWFVPRS